MNKENKKDSLEYELISDESKYDYHKMSNSQIEKIKDTQELIQEQWVKPLEKALEAVREIMKPLTIFIASKIKTYTPYFQELAEALEQAKANPNSFLNWFIYSEKLSEFLWTIPFEISAEEMKDIFEQINSEEEFDIFMNKYFDNKKVEKLFDTLNKCMPVKHRTIFKQIQKAFYNKSYALANAGILSIIDELCTYFLINKGCVKRKGMFKPIIENLEENIDDRMLVLEVMILSNNIDIIYEDISFTQKIVINTNKKTRRNPCQHGQAFSNRKIDTLMLLNTMYYLLFFRTELKQYKGKLAVKGKTFYLASTEERRAIKEKIKSNNIHAEEKMLKN